MSDNSLLHLVAYLGPTISMFLAGFSFSPSNITLPSLYDLPTSASMVVAESLYKRGGAVVVPLGLLSATCAGTAAYMLPRIASPATFLKGAATDSMTVSQRQTLLATSGIFTIANLPWTALVMGSAIKRIVEIAGSKALQSSTSRSEVTELLWKWQWMNYVRTFNALAGAVVGFYALLS